MIQRIAHWSIAGAIRSVLGLAAKVRQPAQGSEGAKLIWKAQRWAERKNVSRHRKEYQEWLTWCKRMTEDE